MDENQTSANKPKEKKALRVRDDNFDVLWIFERSVCPEKDEGWTDVMQLQFPGRFDALQL